MCLNFMDIFTQVAILFIIILVGYFVRRFNMLDDESTSKLSSLVMNIFLPAMIITAMQIDFEAELIPKMLSLFVVSMVMFAVSIIISFIMKLFVKSESELGIYQYALVFSNSGFMGYPVVEAVLGSGGIFYAAIFNLPFNFICFTLGVYFLSKGRPGKKFSLKSMVNSSIIAVVIGLILFFTKTKLPVFINEPLVLLGNVTTPLSMLVIGSMLAGSSATECFKMPKMYILTFLRLIVIPVAVFIVLKPFNFDSLVMAIPVVIGAMPSAANTAIMANEYGADVSLASQAVFFTTLFSVVSIPLISVLLLS
ncbi:AEC family transporter [Peptacetobacter hominis]|uniref:AEC family transporter n=2 Tax=Peptacetobacter hominis TaxID=2743610 RepID=A0A544QVV6_9FIRM|nr:AEC family transporter [Peptacetobacter hominis]